MASVSAVISTYNRSHYLRWTLGAVLNQQHVDFEVVVVDNGSSDDTQARLATLNDSRMRVIRNPVSLGGIGGRNTGIAAAQGDWIGILDDDDLWAPDKLAAQFAAAEAAQRHWVYAGGVYIDEVNAVVHGRPPVAPEQAAEELPVNWCLPGGISNVLWCKDKLDADGLLDSRLSFTADWDVALRLLRQGPPAAVQRPLVAYRQHGDNASHMAATQQDQIGIMERKFADLRNGRALPVGPQYRFMGSQALIRNDRMSALKAYGQALRHGDLRSLLRAPALAVPRGLHPRLRRLLLSDGPWVRDGEQWIAEVQPAW